MASAQQKKKSVMAKWRNGSSGGVSVGEKCENNQLAAANGVASRCIALAYRATRA